MSLGVSKVILGVRTPSKGQTAKADIENITGRLGVVEVWKIDLESFASVKEFTACANGLWRLDAVILNAGLASGAFNLTPDGWERQIQVNVLSTALIGLLFSTQLARTRKSYLELTPHLVVVGGRYSF